MELSRALLGIMIRSANQCRSTCYTAPTPNQPQFSAGKARRNYQLFQHYKRLTQTRRNGCLSGAAGLLAHELAYLYDHGLNLMVYYEYCCDYATRRLLDSFHCGPGIAFGASRALANSGGFLVAVGVFS